MRKIHFALFTCLSIIISLAGCKLDTPVYPSDLTGGTPTGTNTSSVTYTISGKSTTVKPATFQVIAPGTGTPDGNTQIIAGTNPTEGFSVSFANSKAGTYNIDLIYIGTYLGSTGTITVTELKTTDGFHGTLKGTFTATDLSEASSGKTIATVTGTFDLKL